MKLENIRKRINELSDIIDEKRSNIKPMDENDLIDGKNFLEVFENTGVEEIEEHSKLYNEYRFIQEPKYRDISKYGDIFSLEDFIDNCKSGGFIDYDGSGNYIKNGEMSDITIYPSDITKYKKYRTEFDSVIWFNK